jgi:tetratricopeptide (TPR) repeat protein
MRKFDEIRDDFVRALQVKNWNDIVVHATDLLLINDKLPWVWANRGLGLHGMGHHLDALINYDKALAIEETAAAYNNKGTTYFDLEKCEEAAACFDKALELEPEMAQVHMNIGHVHKFQGDLMGAIEAYRQAVKSDPEYADGQMALGMSLLKAGHLQEGWEKFEWRWKTDQMAPRGLKKPQWKGEDLTNKTILVYAEQGLGDIIQFAPFAGVLAARFSRCKIIIEARQPVKRLLQTIPEVHSVVNVGEKLPEIDYIIPMISLAGMMTPSINSIPEFKCEYFLKGDDVEVWANKMTPLFEKCPDSLKVGICWAGMSRTSQPMAAKIDSLRSATLAQFAPLAKIPGIAWVSLQKGPPSSQVQKPPTGMTIGDFTEDMYDFYETCCAIENCDLVISVDTAVVHAAAAIGKPTWLLSRWDGCWRWFGDREDSPWYPSLRQFVQPSPHDWDGMIQNVAVELEKLVQAKNST